ncbi:MAG: LemA family protein [Bacilli bacterium]
MNILIYTIIVIIILLLIYILLTHNAFIKLNNNVNEAFATMDVYLKKRWELIPNIVASVKGYAKHEKDTLNNIVQLRNSQYDNLSIKDKIKTNEQLTTGISKLMMLSENYPELKANENFLDLSTKLTKIEDDIANSRKYYNAVVKNLNNKVEMFPSNIIAKIFGYKTAKMFEAIAVEKENVKVELQ